MLVIYHDEQGQDIGVDQTSELPQAGEQIQLEDRETQTTKDFTVERVTRKLIRVSQSSIVELWLVELD